MSTPLPASQPLSYNRLPPYGWKKESPAENTYDPFLRDRKPLVLANLLKGGQDRAKGATKGEQGV